MRRPTTEERVAAELRARRSLEARKGSPFTDEEWREATANLIALFRVLVEWELRPKQQTPGTATAPENGRTRRARKRRK